MWILKIFWLAVEKIHLSFELEHRVCVFRLEGKKNLHNEEMKHKQYEFFVRAHQCQIANSGRYE